MKLSRTQLRNLIKEEIEMGMVELPRADIIELLASAGPDTVADMDYVDTETGEFIWGKGKKAKTSMYHPDFVAKTGRKLVNGMRPNRKKTWKRR